MGCNVQNREGVVLVKKCLPQKTILNSIFLHKNEQFKQKATIITLIQYFVYRYVRYLVEVGDPVRSSTTPASKRKASTSSSMSSSGSTTTAMNVPRKKQPMKKRKLNSGTETYFFFWLLRKKLLSISSFDPFIESVIFFSWDSNIRFFL